MKKLNEKDKKVTTKLGARKTIQLIELSRKMFNCMCLNCKKIIMRDPKTDHKNFCDACQEAIKPYMEKMERL